MYVKSTVLGLPEVTPDDIWSIEASGLSNEEQLSFRSDNPELYELISVRLEKIAPQNTVTKAAIFSLVSDVLRVASSTNDRIELEKIERNGQIPEILGAVVTYQEVLDFPI